MENPNPLLGPGPVDGTDMPVYPAELPQAVTETLQHLSITSLAYLI